jgi:hypothetical protein
VNVAQNDMSYVSGQLTNGRWKGQRWKANRQTNNVTVIKARANVLNASFERCTWKDNHLSTFWVFKFIILIIYVLSVWIYYLRSRLHHIQSFLLFEFIIWKVYLLSSSPSCLYIIAVYDGILLYTLKKSLNSWKTDARQWNCYKPTKQLELHHLHGKHMQEPRSVNHHVVILQHNYNVLLVRVRMGCFTATNFFSCNHSNALIMQNKWGLVSIACNLSVRTTSV